MMKKYFIFVLLFVILSSCTTTSLFRVSKIGEEPEDYLERIVYVLPQTLLNITVEFEKETYIPGPYRLFSEKYLGLDDYIANPGYSFRLLNVEVESFTEPDPEHFYSINVIEGEFNKGDYLQLSKYGLILDPSADFDFKKMQVGEETDVEVPFFTDRSVKRNLTEITDTLYKTVIQDTSYVRIPILRKQREAKTLEQKAEEAANFIIKIRKRRFKLLAGQYELFPEGDALAISVEELDKLEKEYLELFLGKRIIQKFTQSFLFIPEESKSSQSHVVASFSPASGLTVEGNDTNSNITIEVHPAGKLRKLESALLGLDVKTPENNLYYRIPDIAEIRVSIVNDILYEGRMPVYQIGELINYPAGAGSKE